MAYILINAGAKSVEDWIKFLIENKQNLLTAGSNITIDENGVISATTGTTYEAGTGIDIIGNTIAIDSSILTQLGLINMKVDIHYTDEEYVNQYIQNDSSHFRLIRTNSNTDKNSAFEITESGIEATYDYSSTIKYVLSLKLGASLEAYYNNTKMSEIVASEDGNCYMSCKDDTDDYININQYQTTVSHKDSNIIKAGTYWLRIDSTNGIQWSDDSGTTWNNVAVNKLYHHKVKLVISTGGITTAGYSSFITTIILEMFTNSTSTPSLGQVYTNVNKEFMCGYVEKSDYTESYDIIDSYLHPTAIQNNGSIYINVNGTPTALNFSNSIQSSSNANVFSMGYDTLIG